MMRLHTALRLTLDPAHPDVISIVGGGGKSSAVFRIAIDLAQAGRRAVITHTARIAAFQTAWSPAVVEVLDGTLPLEAVARALDAHNVCLLTGPVVGDRRAGLLPQVVDALAQAADSLGIAAITVEADGSKMRPAKAPAEHEPVLPATTTLLTPILGLDAVGGAIDSRLFHRDELVRQVLGLPHGSSDRFTPRQAAELLVHAAGGAKGRPPAARLLPIFNKADTPLRLLYGRLAARYLAEHHLAQGEQAPPRGAGVGQVDKGPLSFGGAVGQASLLAAVGDTYGQPVVERWGPLAVVILAAGAGSRFGAPKQLEVVNGRPMLVAALAAAATIAGPIYLVTGAHAELVTLLLAHLPASLDQQLAGRLHMLHNPQWASGQASSLHVSVRNLPGDVEAAIWMPVDQPYLEPALLSRLIAAWRNGADLAAPQVNGELRGAPALFDRRHWSELLEVQGDSGGRTVLRGHRSDVAAIAATEASLRDIDNPLDLT